MIKSIRKNRIMLLIIASILLTVSILYGAFTITAHAAIASQEVWDYQKFANDNGYTYVSQTNRDWEDTQQTERTVYVLYNTNKKAALTELSSVSAMHTTGITTTLSVGADLLTEEETVRQFGIDVSGKVGVVVGNIGGGWKWGNAENRTTMREGTAIIPSTQSSTKVTRIATAYVREYYLYVYTVKRDLGKDSKGKFDGTYNNYRHVKESISGKFESFDLQSGIAYMTAWG